MATFRFKFSPEGQRNFDACEEILRTTDFRAVMERRKKAREQQAQIAALWPKPAEPIDNPFINTPDVELP